MGVNYGTINLAFFVFIYKKGKCVILVFMSSVGVLATYILTVNVRTTRSSRKYPTKQQFQEGLGKKKCIILFKNLECTIWPVFPVIKKINI